VSDKIDSGEKVSVVCEHKRESIDLFSLSFIIGVILIFSFTILLNLKHEIADEGFHSPQIYSFFTGNYEQTEGLTVIPVYHGIIAGVLKAFDFFSVKFARFISLLICTCTLPIFWQVCQQTRQKECGIRTLMFVSLPIIIPFFSLLYTDIPALLFTLMMVLFTLKERYILASLVGIIAVLMRQPNLIWLVFCGSYVGLTQLYKLHQESKLKQLKPFVFASLKILPYLLVFIGFAVFFSQVGKVAVGDFHQHVISINLSNLCFFLLLFFFLFLPYNIWFAKENLNLLITNRILLFFLLPLFFLYMISYNNDHQYNAYGLSFYLRNHVLHFTTEFLSIKTLMFIPIFWAALTIANLTKRSSNKLLLCTFYAFAALSFVPLPVIEQRYYITALALFIAFKPETNLALDRVTVATFIPISACLLLGISRHDFFL